ncbi:hypothetical protein LTR37_001632 [Vermiconidia calcicola]|uniref:Uncharacterized protein n=1 Tax=Vermiconidia calcicola TaxID=1690605 RepID=A0ACC3NVR2_9PEZI|nr:hypothetical protein LTR37_001632 [Vermiconidia calcicola]
MPTFAELVFDASYYDLMLAGDLTEYLEACKNAFRAHGQESDWHDTDAEDYEALKKIRFACRQGRPEHATGARGDCWDHRINFNNVQDQERILNNFIWSGYYKSYPEYRRLCRAQNHVLKPKVCSDILEYTLKSLPKITRVVFTDWRGLGYPGESYSNCALRLFGRTLAPQPIYCGTEEECQAPRDAMRLLLQVIRTHGQNLTSFSVGPHPFETNFSRQEALASDDPTRSQRLMLLPLLQNLLEEPFSRSLTHLRLPISFEHYQTDSTGSEMFPVATALNRINSLTHLQFAITESQDWDASGRAPVLFTTYIARLHLPHLRFLDLRNWKIQQPRLQTILQRHASTLRQLRLLHCYLSGDQAALAGWVGTHLALEGIELTSRQDTDSTLQVSRPRVEDDSVVEGFDDYYLMEDDHESTWLGGRENLIVREQPQPMLGNEVVSGCVFMWYEKAPPEMRNSW